MAAACSRVLEGWAGVTVERLALFRCEGVSFLLRRKGYVGAIGRSCGPVFSQVLKPAL